MAADMTGADYYRVSPPNARFQEQMVTESLIANSAPASELRGLRPGSAAVARQPLFPDRFGMEARQPTIWDVLATSLSQRGNYSYRSEVSGGAAGYEGTMRPSATGWW